MKLKRKEVLQKNIRDYLSQLQANVSTNEHKSKKVTKAADNIGTDKAKDALIAKFPVHTKLDNIYFKKFFSMFLESTSPKLPPKPSGISSISFSKSAQPLMVFFKLDKNSL